MGNTYCTFYVIGNPIDHSLSPVLQNYLLEKFNIPGRYCACRVEPGALGPTLAEFADHQVRGINVTTPLKTEVIRFLTELTPEAEAIGSVNTIKIDSAGLIGHNTDATGFRISLHVAGWSVQNKNVLLLGAGGAARAVAVALAREGCRQIIIANRSLDKAQRLIDDLAEQNPQQSWARIGWDRDRIETHLASCGLLVNATTIGMGGSANEMPLPIPTQLPKNLMVYDLIYRPLRTPLLQQAEQQQLPFMNGLAMLIYQGIASLGFWMGENFVLNENLYLELAERLRREICQE
ncbi:MAG: shikimate dehydrogenase [candidate division KSB1 bacterium]|nr:shikimate dehydrogenase [candidate division KSB1 bacterium]MDZ7318645.1 shikimate dehydrogenase [candidate division KSB1 bacterium]MDZ7340024.1 shikimate dehydrogenase [candidate division KSB1 bacterium]